MTDQIKFMQICEIEPRVSDLYQDLITKKRRIKSKPWHLWEMIKDQLGLLVGWEAISTDPRITTPQAYDAVYQAFYSEWTASDHPGKGVEARNGTK
jgi:hypothetical protein